MENKTAEEILKFLISKDRNSFHATCYDYDGAGGSRVYVRKDLAEIAMEEYHSLRSREDKERIKELEKQLAFEKYQVSFLLDTDHNAASIKAVLRIRELEREVEGLTIDIAVLKSALKKALSGELPEVKEDKAFGQLKVDYDNLQSRSDQQEERIKELKDERDSLSQMVLEMVGESEEQIMKEFLEFKLNRKA